MITKDKQNQQALKGIIYAKYLAEKLGVKINVRYQDNFDAPFYFVFEHRETRVLELINNRLKNRFKDSFRIDVLGNEDLTVNYVHVMSHVKISQITYYDLFEKIETEFKERGALLTITGHFSFNDLADYIDFKITR